jgi:hypothetical protein
MEREGPSRPPSRPSQGRPEREVEDTLSGFGVNAGLVEEIRQRYEVDPTSVHESWTGLFEGRPADEAAAAAGVRDVLGAVRPAAARGQARARAAPDPRLPRPRPPHRRDRPARQRRLLLPGARSGPLRLRYTTTSTAPSSPATCRAARSRRCARSWLGCAPPTAARSASSTPTCRIRGARSGCASASRRARTPPAFDTGDRLRILEKLAEAELFERFLHTKFLGQKRFSLEGAESLIPLLDAIVEDAPGHGVREFVIGMAHRGRLNVLSNVLASRSSRSSASSRTSR